MSTGSIVPLPELAALEDVADRPGRVDSELLTDGVNESLTILGRTLHVQTEIRAGRLCTEIFSGGRVIARREATLDEIERNSGIDAQRSRMNAFHQRTIGRAKRRASSFRRDRQSGNAPLANALEAALKAELAEALEQNPHLPRIDESRRDTVNFKVLKPEFPGTSEEGAGEASQHSRTDASPPNGTSNPLSRGSEEESSSMAKVNLEPLAAIDGFVGTCLVDSDSGMMLGSHGGGPVNLELAAAGNTQVVRAKRKTLQSLALEDGIEDILISLGKQYHLIRPLESNPTIFLYLVLDRSRANLAMARHELKAFESKLRLG